MNGYKSHIVFFIKNLGLALLSQALCVGSGNAQGTTSPGIFQKLISIEEDTAIAKQKLQQVMYLKASFENSKLPQDSVYARILHRIGLYESKANRDFSKAISFTIAAVQLNMSGKKNCSKFFAIKSYNNLAFYYDSVMLYSKSISYFDSTIILAKNFIGKQDVVLDCRLRKAVIFLQTGDYQKNIEESTIGLLEARKMQDSLSVLFFLGQREQSYFFQNQLQPAMNDATLAESYALLFNNKYELATAIKTKALINEKKQLLTKADSLFRKAIYARIQSEDFAKVGDDYMDYGNFFLNLKNYQKAKDCYFKTVEYAKKGNDPERLARGYSNISQVAFYEKNYASAQAFYQKALGYLKLSSNPKDFFSNPTAKQFSIIPNKELVLVLAGNKTEFLLNLYKNNRSQDYINACIKTALLADSVITSIRYEQVGEQSKLYWRNRTREFYTNAVEACYLANDITLAFYFMEKSRAVLLNDQLNALSASLHLPAAEAVKEEALQMNIIAEQQKFSALSDTSRNYYDQQNKLLLARENYERYIKSLEQKFPAYYQFKYAESIPPLTALQHVLAINKQSFVHYFVNDTLVYILGITPGAVKLIKLKKKDFDIKFLSEFIQLCADAQMLNNHYSRFAQLSNSIYRTLFEPLKLPKGRVIICADNFLLPFEALCTDTAGSRFLIYDYAFSYVYSARYLMNKFISYEAKGDFLGVAPASFAAGLNVIDLKNSAAALDASANYYNHVQLLTNDKAAKSNFLKQLPGYTVVNIFSHATADTTGTEPLLFMADSVIHLSELQLINNPATQLVVLSACQTNVGKTATGEGIYSLARGFASAGIPAVSATLWKADEETIYKLSEIFNRNLSTGMSKDEALQQAKLSFLQDNKTSSEKLLPYYWANMILVGNTDPVKLTANSRYAWWLAAGIFMLAILVIFWTAKRYPTSRPSPISKKTLTQ